MSLYEFDTDRIHNILATQKNMSFHPYTRPGIRPKIILSPDLVNTNKSLFTPPIKHLNDLKDPMYPELIILKDRRDGVDNLTSLVINPDHFVSNKLEEIKLLDKQGKIERTQSLD